MESPKQLRRSNHCSYFLFCGRPHKRIFVKRIPGSVPHNTTIGIPAAQFVTSCDGQTATTATVMTQESDPALHAPSAPVPAPPPAQADEDAEKQRATLAADENGAAQPRASAGVWGSTGVAELKRSLMGRIHHGEPALAQSMPTPTPLDDEHRALYKCARRVCLLTADGNQRAMTDVESRTLEMWLAGKIFLDSPPTFVSETHVRAERSALLAFQRSYLGFRLYGRLPVGWILPTMFPKWHLSKALLAAASTAHDKERVKAVVRTSKRIECSSLSPIVEFIFTRPVVRDQWANAKLKIGNNMMTLRTKESPSVANKRNGYDASARALLYQVHVLGMSEIEPEVIHSWLAAATARRVLEIDAIGKGLFNAHRWAVTFDSIECPKEILRTHLLRVNTIGVETLVYLHHPGVNNRLPCTSCRFARHLRKDCTAKNPTEMAEKFTLAVDVEPTTPPAINPAAGGWGATLKLLRESVAPQLAERIRAGKLQNDAIRRAAWLIAKEADVAAKVRNKARAEKLQLEAARRDAGLITKAAAAAAKLRNKARQHKRTEDAQRKKQKLETHRNAKAAMTAELKQMRIGSARHLGKSQKRAGGEPAKKAASKPSKRADVQQTTSVEAQQPNSTADKSTSEPSSPSQARDDDAPREHANATDSAGPGTADIVSGEGETRTSVEGGATEWQSEQATSLSEADSAGETSSSDDVMMESTYDLDETMRFDDLAQSSTWIDGCDDGESTSDDGLVSIPEDLAATFEQEVIPDQEEGDRTGNPSPNVERLPGMSALLTAQEAKRRADLHAQTMKQSRTRKAPANTSPEVARAATAKSERRRAANLITIQRWVDQHCAKKSPVLMPVNEKGIGSWIADRALELAKLVAVLPHPIEHLEGMKFKWLKNFGHAINSETQLAVIRSYASNKNLCDPWATTAANQRGSTRWFTTDNNTKWKKLTELDATLRTATVEEQVQTEEWGVLNVLCTLLPHSAPEDSTAGVVMPQTKPSLYWTSTAVREAIERILSDPADWTSVPALLEGEDLARPNRS